MVYFGEADLECYEGDLGLDAQDWKALTRLSLREAAIKRNPKMTSWYLVVSARLFVQEIHTDAKKKVEPFAQESVAKVQKAKIKQDRLPN